MDMLPERMWINQPSTLDPLHHLHGTNVLAMPDPHDRMQTNYRCFFLSGETISLSCDRLCLSRGWRVANPGEEP